MDTQEETKIKVSVIIPVYNGGQHFAKCLDDLIHQTLQEIEIICVNDGSTDNTEEIMERYARWDKRVIPVNQPNSGAGVARNYGMTFAKGEYLSFLDADDFYEPEMLERAYAGCKAHDSDMCIFAGDRYDDKKAEYLPMKYALRMERIPCNPFNYLDVKEDLFDVCVGWAWDKLYRREFVEREKLQFQNTRTSNDLLFTFLSLVKADKIAAIDELLVHHRINVSDSLSVTREKSWNCFYIAASALGSELKSCGAYVNVEKAYVNWLAHFSFWNLDTIVGAAHRKVYELIKTEVLPELDVHKYPKNYIKPSLMKRVLEVEASDYDTYLMNDITRMRKTIQDSANSDKVIADLKKQVKRQTDKTKAAKQSATFKVGKAVLYIPSKLKKVLKGKH